MTDELKNFETDQLMTARQIAPLLGLSKSWVYLHADELPTPVVLGRNVRWWKSDILSWLNSSKREAVNA